MRILKTTLAALAIAADEARRQEQIDAIGLAVDLLLDPVEFRAEALGGVGGHPEDAEATGTGTAHPDQRPRRSVSRHSTS